jgi:hypothetical protein
MDPIAILRALADDLTVALAHPLPVVSEAGRVFSAANEQALRAVAQAINALLAQLQQAPVAVPGSPVAGAPPQSAPVAVPSEAAETIAQEAVLPLSEAARGGKGLIRVITPGWGSSGFYSPDVLERDAPKAFPAGTKMFWDHPAVDDKRPERSLRDLAAELTSDAKWMRDGPEGPGVYAPASVFSAYRPSIEELQDSIGVSIRASAHIRPGEAEGKKGPIVERLLASPTNSVDFVTIPGRGGRVAALFEAARGRNDAGTTEDDNVSEAELLAAQEAARAAEQRAVKAEAAAASMTAKVIASEVLAGVDIPEPARVAVAERVVTDPPMKDGALDADVFRAKVTDEAGKEKAYIDRLTGRGEVRGMGSGTAEAVATIDTSGLAQTFQRLGLSESAAATAAAGRR